MRLDEVPDRAPALPARRPRPHAAVQQGSEYLTQLREKQKARRIYGLMEKQFRNLYDEATRQSGVTGENLLRLLETRLDNVAFRAGWGSSRSQARQFVRHGHVKVNGKRVTIPSYQVRKGDVVTLGGQGPGDHRRAPQHRHARPPDARRGSRAATNGSQVTVRDLPLRAHIDVPVREQLIVELYSK